jgi:hypothetical protein
MQAKHPVREEIVEEIRLKAKSWTPKAVEHNHLRDVPMDQIHMKLGIMGATVSNPITDTAGSYILQGMSKVMDFIPSIQKFLGVSKRLRVDEPIEIPEHFDSREKWPQCIHDIRDQ